MLDLQVIINGLEMAINGRGAFRRFKDTVNRYGIEDQWYAFRDAGYAAVARRWCEENDVEYHQAGKAPAHPDDMKKQLTGFFSDEDEADAVKPDKASMADPSAVKDFLSTLFGGMSHVDVTINEDDEDDDDDDDDDDVESFTPEQAAKLYELHKQLQSIQGQLEDLAGEIEGEEAPDALYDASSSVEDAVNSLGEIIEGGITINIVADEKTSTDGIIRLSELLRKLAGKENGDE